MCGLAGFLQLGGVDTASATDLIKRMSNSLQHRGPDDFGFWIDEPCGLALGHRRLAIVDLSPGGHQPMISPSGRYVIAFNGEIYNHLALRRETENAGLSRAWRGRAGAGARGAGGGAGGGGAAGAGGGGGGARAM